MADRFLLAAPLYGCKDVGELARMRVLINNDRSFHRLPPINWAKEPEPSIPAGTTFYTYYMDRNRMDLQKMRQEQEACEETAVIYKAMRSNVLSQTSAAEAKAKRQAALALAFNNLEEYLSPTERKIEHDDAPDEVADDDDDDDDDEEYHEPVCVDTQSSLPAVEVHELSSGITSQQWDALVDKNDLERYSIVEPSQVVNGLISKCREYRQLLILELIEQLSAQHPQRELIRRMGAANPLTALALCLPRARRDAVYNKTCGNTHTLDTQAAEIRGRLNAIDTIASAITKRTHK